ncbi:hypothetical protein C5Y96_16790 [Blastopirellula marina]|uniref:Uncharacterized protein n=1 Tax=Blastopirellula marina TaxID=124 RepID=A0A2S8F7A1_9BACT|nr:MULTISPECIES: hypothetical protein [Pirellulaceae]PQO28032.1 hypothetical protein C5Y96_16790 [Blastopirellula marina]RCS48457.1 hypothetical protein DTL36_16810 [Bremerella cremea]
MIDWLRKTLGIFLAAFVITNTYHAPCAAQETNAVQTIEFQRVYVPENRSQEWPRSGFEFAPQMQLNDFEKLISEFARSQNDLTEDLAVSSLTYHATLNGRTLQGEAEFEVEVPPTETSGFISLKNSNLFYFDQHQRLSSMPTLWVGGNGSRTGIFLKQIQPSFTLDWSYQATARSSDELTVDLSLAFAPKVDFYLELPSQWQMVLQEGILLDGPNISDASGEETNTWHLSPQWQGKLRFSLLSSDRLFQSDAAVATQSTRYHVQDNVCEVNTQVSLQSPPQATLDLSIPKDLIVTRASVNGLVLENLDLHDTAEGNQSLIIPHTVFTMGETAAISVQGLSPITIGNYSRIDLPIISTTSQPTESHVVAVQLDEGINLSFCTLKNAQQVEFVPHNSLGRSNLKFRLFDESAQIGLQLFRRQSKLRMSMGHKATVNDLMIQSDSVLHLLERDNPTDHLELPLSPGWQVESVQRFPEGTAVRWEETTRDRQRLLRIEDVSEMVDFQVRLRRTRENDFGNLKIADFRPFDFPPGIGHIEWLSVKPAAGFDLQLEPEGLVARHLIADAPVDIQRMFGTKWQIPAFEIRGRSDLQHVTRVTRKRATYDAEIEVQIRANESSTRRQASIRLSGIGLLPETIFVWSTQPWSQDVTWTTPDLAPIRWTAITTSAGEGPNQRDPYFIYELRPPSDSTFPLILRGNFPLQDTPFSDPLLLAVPSAESQSGVLTLTTPATCRLTVDPALLRKIYLDSDFGTSSEVTRLEYRPDEIRRLAENISQLVNCQWQGGQPLPDIFSTQANHCISVENNGRQRMNSVWTIVSQRSSTAVFTLPNGARVDLIQWAGEPWTLWKQSGQTIEVEVPEAVSSAELEMHYQVNPGPISLIRSITPEFATAAFPTSTDEREFALGSLVQRVEYPSPRWSTFGDRIRNGLWSGLFQADLISGDQPPQDLNDSVMPLPSGSIWVVHRVSLLMASLTLFMVALFGGAYGFLKMPRVFCVLLLVLILFVPWLPDVTAPLTSAYFLGLILGGIGSYLLIPPAIADRKYPTGSTVTVTSLVVAFTLCWLNQGATPTMAQEPMADSVRKTTVYPVLIPIDSQRKPVGQAYLPLPLYERLSDLSDQPEDIIPLWIVEGMRYEFSVVDSLELTPEITVTTHIELVTAKTNQTIRLPFDSKLGTGLDTAVDQVGMNSDTGSILPNPFETTTNELVLSLKEMGHHTIVIKSRVPLQQSESTPPSLHIDTPSLASTAVTIADSMQLGSPLIRFNNREISVEASSIRQTIPLGTVTGFDLEWKSSELQSTFEFRELDLLEFNDENVQLRVRLDLTNRPTEIGPILIAVDSRLTLDMQQALGWTAEVKSTSISASTRTYAIHLLDGDTPIQQVDLRFSLEGAQQVGQLRFPNVEVINGLLQRRWVAVAATSQLQVQSQAQSRVSILSQEEFLREWKEEEPRFRFAVAVGTMEPLDWLISTRPIATRGNADLRYRLKFDEDGYDFDIKAQIETYSGKPKQYVVEMIPGCEVESVQYLVDGLLRPIQWHYDSKSGELGVLLLTDVSGLQELAINGRKWLSPQVRDVKMAPIKIREVHTQSSRVQITRDHSVLVRTPSTMNLIPVQEEISEPNNDRSVSVGMWQVVDPALPLEWQILPNNVVISSDLLTVVNRLDSQWRLKWVGKIDIRSGSVGYLQWLVPKEIELDVTSIDGFDVTSRLLPDESAYVYTFVPRSTLPSSFSFEWQGTLKTTPGRRVSFSPIRLIGQHRVSQWVAVPREVDDQEVLWLSQALRPTTVSDRWLIANSPVTHQLLNATRPDYVCQMMQRANPTGNPVVNSLETTLQLDSTGRAIGLTRISVLPQGNNAVEFKIPNEVQVLGLSVDFDHQRHIEHKTDRIVRIPLKSNSLPQVVEIAFSSKLEPSQDQLYYELERPSLNFSTKAEELLRISLPSQWTLENAPHLDRVAWSRDQVTSAFQLKDASRDTQSGLSTAEIQRWDSLRMEQAFTAVSQFQEVLRQQGETPDNTLDIVTKLLGDNATEVESWAVSSDPLKRQTSDAYYAAAPTMGERFRYYRLSTPSGPLSIRQTSPHTYSYWPPIATSLLALVAIGLLVATPPLLVQKFHHARGWMSRNPQVCGVLVGLFWWLFLPPHFIGLLLIGIVVWASLPFRASALLGRS